MLWHCNEYVSVTHIQFFKLKLLHVYITICANYAFCTHIYWLKIVGYILDIANYYFAW